MQAEETYAEGFLQDAAVETLQEAVAANHHAWLTLLAQASGGETRQAEGVTWTLAGTQGDAYILFPRLREEEAGARLDEIVAYYRERQPEKMVGCWSLDPPQPADLDIRLLARGFQPGWQPRWMHLDLARMNAEHPAPEGLEVGPVEDAGLWDVDDLPYYDRAGAACLKAAEQRQPQRVRHFAARLDGKIVGHSHVFLTTGPLGVAGIYGVGVVPEARKKGVGKAVTGAACRFAREQGCHHALLNGTGERMYRQLGFEGIGFGWTWWLDVPRLESRLPTPEQIACIEAIGRGDSTALESFRPGLFAEPDTPTANGMTLMEIAVHAGQPSAAEWLQAQGATLDLVSAWDLGWKERAAQMLAAAPERANRRSGEMGTTPLHVAAERNDIELARLILTANPDINLEDTQFHSTPLGWARHFGHAELLALLEAHQGRLA